MELKEINGNAVANPLQELQTRNGSTALAPSNGVATKDPSLASKENHQENPKVNLVEQPHLDKSQITMKVNGKTTPGTNGTQAIHLTLNDAQVANPTTSGQEEANKTPIPEIHINGEDGESPVSADIMRPEDEDDGDDAPLFERGSTEVGQKPKKKKKSKSKRGLKAPSGFEEYYVDAPLTPAEHEEEKGIYHSSVPFRERIEIAIQRFFAKRNLNSERKDVFDKYLAFGGVDSGPKMFSGGLDAKTLSDLTAPEIATMTAKHSVGEDKDDGADSKYVVDFDGVAKAFLSSQLPLLYDLWSQDAVKVRVAVIRNFLNYLLHHDVCPEYNEQVYAARDTCDKAVKELWLTVLASRSLPGKFNTACSEIFGGALQGLYIGDKEWAQGFPSNGPGISAQMARKTFKTGLIARASEDTLKTFKKQDEANKIKILNETETGLEVTELIPAEEEVLELYQSTHGQGLKPLGRMKAKTWYYPGAPPEDLTEEEIIAAASTPKEIKEYEFWVEDEALKNCFVGMKLITVVKELSFGVLYFDSLLGIYCSFYNFIPNEEIIGWREPEETWLPMRENRDFEAMEDGDDEDEKGPTDGAFTKGDI